MNDDKANVFVEPEVKIAGLTLRPFTAETLVLLRRTGNKLIEGNLTEDVEFQVGAFLYIHTADRNAVRRTCKDADAFENAVMDFLSRIKISDFGKCAEAINGIMQQSSTSMDYEVEGSDNPKATSPVGLPATSSE